MAIKNLTCVTSFTAETHWIHLELVMHVSQELLKRAAKIPKFKMADPISWPTAPLPHTVTYWKLTGRFPLELYRSFVFLI